MRILPTIPAFPGKKPDTPKWPTVRFAEADAADEIVKQRKKTKKKKKKKDKS